MRSKYLIYGVFIIVGCLLVLFILSNSEISPSSNNVEIKSTFDELSSSNKPLIINERSLDKKSSGSSNSVDRWSPMGDAATAEKIKSWFAARGNYSFYGPDAYSEYKNYDNETLTKLSDDGDLRAMHVLSERAGNLLERKSILIRAAVYGSTEALSRLSTIQDLDKRDTVKTVEDKKMALFEILAYQEAAEIRGDWWPKIQMRDYYTKQYQIELNSQDNALIAGMAKEIYEELSQQRKRLGLDDFDNTVPDEVMKFYEEMLRPL
ncbi:MAG TPA: hypothetical protein VL995_13235 [Cellvibrio sp.]|nr:hypothetical protein [Cellvibrio sp.]